MQRHYKAAHAGARSRLDRRASSAKSLPPVKKLTPARFYNCLIPRSLGNGPKTAIRLFMNINTLSGTNSAYLQSLFNTTFGKTTSTSGSTASTTGISLGNTQDTNQLSPFAQLLSTLQQLQQSNPTEYQQVTQQIATNLTNAASTATADGNTSEATQLTQLATDFTTASQSGQLPNVADLSQAIGGGHHHHGHHHHGGASATDTTSSSSSTSSTGSTSNSTSNLLAQFLDPSTSGSSNQNQPLNPMSIIMNTLTNAGITTNS